MPLRRPALILIVTAGLLWSGTGIAYAHARLVRSNPAADVLLPAAPARIHLWFSEDLNGAASRIVVWDRNRDVVSASSATLLPGRQREMQVPLKPLRPGTYLVLWTSVSAQDGHILHGFYLFSVKVRGPGPSIAGLSSGSSQGFPDLPGAVSLIAHWIELLAAVTWAGAALFSALVPLPLDDAATGFRRVIVLTFLSLLLLIASSTAVLAVQAYGISGNDWSAVPTRGTLLPLFADQYGQVWIGRQVLAIVALLFLLVYGRQGGDARAQKEAASASAIIGCVYLYALAASGHAAAANIGALPGHHGGLFSVSIGVDWLHLLADALWLGGQIAIVLILIPALRPQIVGDRLRSFLAALDRFSPMAYTAVALYLLSGLFSAKVQIPSWYAFFYSIYGRALIVKMGLIGAMMLISVNTVYLVRPGLRRSLAAETLEPATLQVSVERSRRLARSLVSWLRVNPVLGAAVLLATSVMFYYPVPVGFAPPGPSAYVVHGGGMTATVRIEPDRSGPNRISVLLLDAKRRPIRQAHITILTTMLDMVMGTGVASMTESGPGRFAGTTDLGMGGHWRLQVLVYRPSGLTRMLVNVRVGS